MSAIVKPPTREQQAQQIAWLEAEVERLSHNEAFHVERAAAQDAEIERLKAALREIADHRAAQVSGIHAIARAALEGSDGALFPTKKICPECGQPMREGGYCDHIPF